MRYGWWMVGILLLSSCLSIPEPAIEEEEGISIQLPYSKAFEKIVNLLESEGYNIALADKGVGIIETVPRQVPGEEGSIHHNALLSLLLRGNHSETTVYLRVIVTSDYPDERKKMIESLKSLSP